MILFWLNVSNLIITFHIDLIGILIMILSLVYSINKIQIIHFKELINYIINLDIDI